MIEGLFAFPRDIRLEPIESLPDAVRADIEYEIGDFALTRPQSRTPTLVVSASTAKLLQLFYEPATIADAIIRFSQTEQASAAEVLNEAFPVLRTFVETGILLPSDSQLLSRIDFLLKPGDLVGDLTVDQAVSVVLDTEVYRARTSDGAFLALKLGRRGSEDRMSAMLSHEAAILTLLDSSCSPGLIAQGDHLGRPFLAMEWCQGVDVLTAAGLVRTRDPLHRAELKEILIATVEAYARLHEQHVLHGDVHPRNVLMCRSRRATIIDFGYAVRLGNKGEVQRQGRGVVDLYMEPELAYARANGGTAPPSTEAGEQYSVAALSYALIAGAHTHDFVLEKGQMLRQLLFDPPRTFAERGVEGFAHAERVLRRALEKGPTVRFASMTDFAAALRQALDLDCDAEHVSRRVARGAASAPASLLNELLERARLGGELAAKGVERPSASVNFGSAGLAFALLRIAQQRDDGSLLAAADAWSQAAIRAVHGSGTSAFTAPDLEMTQEQTGTVSLYHAAPGVFCVAALVADAQADEERRKLHVEQFVAAAAGEEERGELVFGLAGLMLGCGLLLRVVGTASANEQALLKTLGDDLNNRLLHKLRQVPRIDDAPSGALGVAHGFGGILYSMLQWSRVSGYPVSSELQVRLEELAALAQPVGRGLVWPVSASSRWNVGGMRATWCNGSAGHLQLWLLAHEVLGASRWLELAHGAAWTTYESQTGAADLCCGSAGRAYALLRFFRQGGDRIWLARATELSEHAAAEIRQRQLRKNSLYRGEVGVSLLAADLVQPNAARMPFFEID